MNIADELDVTPGYNNFKASLQYTIDYTLKMIHDKEKKIFEETLNHPHDLHSYAAVKRNLNRRPRYRYLKPVSLTSPLRQINLH